MRATVKHLIYRLVKSILRAHLQEAYERGLTKGYTLGYISGRAETNNMAFIMPNTEMRRAVDSQLNDLLNGKEV